jgi:hypothetical protein
MSLNMYTSHAESIYGFHVILKQILCPENALNNWSLNIQVSIDTLCRLVVGFCNGDVSEIFENNYFGPAQPFVWCGQLRRSFVNVKFSTQNKERLSIHT